MLCMKLGKKLSLAKKAWKGFAFSLQTKLRKLIRSKSIKKSKTRLNSTLSTILRRCLRRFSPRLLNKPTKTRIRTPTALRAHQAHKSFAPVFIDELFKEPALAPAKHVDLPSTTEVSEKKAANGVKTLAAKIEKDAPSTSVTANGQKCPAAKAVKDTPSASESAKGPKSNAEKAVMAAGSTSMAVNGARASAPAKATSSAELPLWGVDARAEQFILQFKKEMRLERQRSFREYQEMLARGAM